MSTPRQRQRQEANPETVSEDAVVNYLHRHPDFFERHPALLAGLKLPHMTGGSAVSLVERQVSILRQRNTKTERKLRELVNVAHTNEKLSGKIHRLSLNLIQAQDLKTVLARLETALHKDFSADHAELVLFDAKPDDPSHYTSRFVRRVASDDPALKPFQTFMTSARPRCGQMRDVQRELLFGQDNLHIGSAALVPLGQASRLGMLAIGNNDATRFHPAMSTDFLSRLGEVVTAAINHCRVQTAAA